MKKKITKMKYQLAGKYYATLREFQEARGKSLIHGCSQHPCRYYKILNKTHPKLKNVKPLKGGLITWPMMSGQYHWSSSRPLTQLTREGYIRLIGKGRLTDKGFLFFVKFKKERETKRFIRFMEVGDNPIIGTLYVRKHVAQASDKVTVTLSLA